MSYYFFFKADNVIMITLPMKTVPRKIRAMGIFA
nr:MAG TPA: hypothetical protein [Caudoviricetes sp.]